MMREKYIIIRILVLILIILLAGKKTTAGKKVLHDYGDALSKSILFFEGQRSGKLPSTQRFAWRKDSALRDGFDKGVDLTGGYYDAGDNVKFNFPMAFSTTVLAWGVLEYGKSMGPDMQHALDAVRWSTDYFLKATSIPGTVFAQVGDPNSDHNCWQRPEDMDTLRTVYAVTEKAPGSEVSAEIAAALTAASLVFKAFGDKPYAKVLFNRAIKVFDFADKYRGNYNDSIGDGVCPFYCDYNGYEDELLWAAAWLHKATKKSAYWNYLLNNINDNFKTKYEGGYAEFGWDAKHAGINVLITKHVLNKSLVDATPFLSNADKFVCSVLPESPTKFLNFTPGGLLFRAGGGNMQNTAARSFLLLAYARYIKNFNHVIRCNEVVITPKRLIHFARSQVNYILGDNPLNMSYMVGYGQKFPQRIHHRGSSLPSIVDHPDHIDCTSGAPYFFSENPNPNMLIGAVVGGPDIDDSYGDDRADSGKSEPITYVNAPLVALFAYFKAHH